MATNEHITNIVLDAAMMPEMSEREKALRDVFVKEYLVDFDAFAAALRCGFMRSFAGEYATKFMEEPYVRQQIQLHQLDVQTNVPLTEDEYTKKKIIARLMKEAHFEGKGSSHAARVAALGKLASLHGMDVKVAPGSDGMGVHRGGVMAVPAIADINEWEATAVASQERLVAHARD